MFDSSLRLNRRNFLAAGGGLVVALSLPSSPRRAAAQASPGFAPNAFIRIDRQGIVTMVMPMAEMGQGIHTAHAMLLAEELDVGLDQVRLELSPASDALYGNPLFGPQSTGGSTSIRAFWMPLRQAGAVARTLLLEAAAQKWGVDPKTCRAESGSVFETSGSRHLAYGQLVDAAGTLPAPAPESVALKDRKDFKIIGKPHRRLDTPGKVNGTTVFGIDTKIPGMKIAAIAISPVFGGKPKSVDEKAALAVRGVHQVVLTDQAVAVVADHMGAAKKGLDAAAIQWDEGPNATVNSADIIRQLKEASNTPGAVARSEGDVEKALAGATRRLEAVYQLPFLAHATMEPMNCTVHVKKDACDVWVGTQVPTMAQTTAAQLTGLPVEAVTIHNHLIGGGFGRRLEVDGIEHAVKVAQQVDGPVKVIWSREEDIQHDMYRPYYYDRLSAGLDASGKPVAWTHRVSGSSVTARYFPAGMQNGVDPDGVEGADQPPYAFPAIHVEFKRVEPPAVPTAWWRGVGATHNIFVVESFIDELAAAAKADPVEFRKALLSHNPRALGVLTLATQKAGWGAPMPQRQGRGVSVQFAFGTYMATVAEVEVGTDGTVKVHRLVCAVDCGLQVNPDTIAAQMEGGSIFGLTAALHGAITLKDGRVEQGNFDTYLPMRMDEVPVVETHFVNSAEAPGGMGEAGTAAVFPALTNAIFAATGKRIRTLPVDTKLLKSI
ncbi:xanthine dehydrogenase family protein molybdopterin-binding subunit [Mesorhizobium waimense]|uniref:Xanthine dehydrogenase family protein molybdopterin-binding subunit n=1 Tax=Mesorhizobium waimense TaxID=1300307 RepID=A0A3A5K3V4_9HYPH|nr:xanthine dehydrogenase family protein molybdopterin-binding subunit [Mesorhizobium waimense]RJT29088.1 xanthine dehydrogenase family protein molybdopterin-binding subunit [Mesorhizobium waimense]